MNRFNVYIEFQTYGFSDEDQILCIPESFFCKTVQDHELGDFVSSLYKQLKSMGVKDPIIKYEKI